MLIDWFTVAAQVVNFLILVWLLKRFLYKPILRALDSREQQIALTLADADVQKAEAKRERDEFQRKNEAFDQQRSVLLSQANDDAKAERERLLDQARQEANALRVERQEALKREQQHLNAEIARRTREEVYAIARKTLTDLAGESLEVRMSEVFVRRIQALDHETIDEFVAAVKSSSEPVMVRSAFELAAEQRTAIQAGLNAAMSAEIPIRFETVPEVIGGIELSAKGRKIAWSIEDYLGSLEKNIGDLLVPSNPQANTEPEPQSAAQSAAREQTQ